MTACGGGEERPGGVDLWRKGFFFFFTVGE